MVSSHPWDAKLVLSLSAFAVNYGEFWLVFQSYNSNDLAKSMAILKQVPEILGRSSMLKPQFNSIKDLIKAMLDVANCIVKFRELPSQYITTDESAFSTALANIPIAVYWAIRCVVACASQIARLKGLQGDEYVFKAKFQHNAILFQLSLILHLNEYIYPCNRRCITIYQSWVVYCYKAVSAPYAASMWKMSFSYAFQAPTVNFGGLGDLGLGS